jgi:hypothetical protein
MRFENRPIPVIPFSVVQLQCTICKAETSAACSCRATYRVKPAERAANAITANSSRSDRAIAAEIGVSPTTVGKVRDQLSSDGQQEELRTGKDGRTRKLPSYIPDPPEIRDWLLKQAMDSVRQMTPAEKVEFIRQVDRL